MLLPFMSLISVSDFLDAERVVGAWDGSNG